MRRVLSAAMIWMQAVVLIGSAVMLMQTGMIFEFRSKVILVYLASMMIPMLLALRLNAKSRRGIHEKSTFAKISVLLFSGTYLVLLFSLVFMNQLRVSADMSIREYFYANANAKIKLGTIKVDGKLYHITSNGRLTGHKKSGLFSKFSQFSLTQ